jgi:histidyl-tRNA synthetase
MKKEMPSTEPYKGVRDFYPSDQFVQEYLFETMKTACERFGYESYSASILEPSEIYRSKTNEEIVAEQTYSFTDRGGRDVTLRPEVTPSIARMVANRHHDLVFPLRWYTIANVFRYERPQRGRLREHWQLNADLFGAKGIEAEAEIIALAHQIMMDLGATEHDFEIRISDRRMLADLLAECELSENEHRGVMRLLDKRDRIDNFPEKLSELITDAKAKKLLNSLSRTTSNAHLEELISLLYKLGVTNAIVDTGIVRGFDYYTGMVFEVFDTASENNRSLFGGGRYDDLLKMFGGKETPAVGFGMGDVTARDFLETRDLLPRYIPAAELMLCILDKEHTAHAMKVAQDLRKEDVTVTVNFSEKRAGDQVRQADKMGVPYIICIGDKERESGQYVLKHLASGDEFTLPVDRISSHLLSAMG